MVKSDHAVIAPAAVIGLWKALNFARLAVAIAIEARFEIQQRCVDFPLVLLLKRLLNSPCFKFAQ